MQKKIFLVVGMFIVLFSFLCLTITTESFAAAVISNGPVSLGVNDEGHLIYDGVGLTLSGVGDALCPGCYCEGWGIAGNGISGGRSEDDGMDRGNLTVDSFSATASTATSVVHVTTLPALVVTHVFAPSAASPTTLFEAKVTITNTGGTTITDIRYRRVMDWDVPPTEFNEYVTIGGLPARNLLFSNDNGFRPVDPLVNVTGTDIAGCGETTNFRDCGPYDHGALFDFGFGDLAPGASKTFSIFYGAAATESAAMTALTAVGAEIYSLGQSNGGQITGSPATFIFGFKGVGGSPIGRPTAVPTMTEWGMIIFIVLAGLGSVYYLRRQIREQ